jgi:ribosomal protein S14
MAQGWLSGRRWEDFTESIKPGRIINMEKPTPTRCAACGKDAAIMDLESGLCRPCFTGKTPAETKRDIENLVHAIGGAA